VKLPNTLEETSGEPLFPTFSEGVGAKGERLTRGVLLSDGELVSVLPPLRVWLDMAEDEPVPFPATALELLIKGVREAKGEELSEGEEEEVFIPVVVSVEARENKEVGEGILGVAVESPPPRPPPPAEAERAAATVAADPLLSSSTTPAPFSDVGYVPAPPSNSTRPAAAAASRLHAQSHKS
jgi:hypothetical protein